ncbi:MAG: V-type ATPase subunit [Candidatus Methanomethylicia archaeon]|nr:V-type ATPase subunit [Candidatus Methanomethylicia archaeon]MCQ5340355.1 V-type ATPase subunit [Candidatus Methanomethylicia archaeon]
MVYTAVRASAKRSKMLSERQLIELTSSKDLNELVSRLRSIYPELADVKPDSRNIEEKLLELFYTELSEFIKIAPSYRELLELLKQEFEEENIAKTILEKYKKGLLNEINEEFKKIIEYEVLGVVISFIAKNRILKIIELTKKYKIYNVLKSYISLKIDEHNVLTIIRGIKNNIRKDILMKLLILEGGKIDKKILSEALKEENIDKALSILGMEEYKDNQRAIERDFEKKLTSILKKMYYEDYVGLGEIIAYIEMKKIEIKNIIRIAISIEKGIIPSTIVQEFII